MAKRRKEKDEEEDKPFKIPKFDKEKFIKKEKKNIKSTFIAFLFGVFMSFICFGFWVLMGSGTGLRWPLVVLVAIASASFVKYIYIKINLDTSDFTKKNWFSSYAIYLISWLIVFIMLVNPPVYDSEGPVVDMVVLPEMQEQNGDILFVAKITDNVGIDKDSLKIEITDPDDEVSAITPFTFEQSDKIVKFLFDNPNNLTGDFSYILTAEDINGLKHTPTIKGTFRYDDDIIDVDETPAALKSIDSDKSIDIEVNPEVSNKPFRVYYTLDNGEEINVNREIVDNPGNYETSPEYEGWEENRNYTMHVFVEVSHYFPNIFVKYNNTIGDSVEYNVSTTYDDDIGEETVPMTWNWSKPTDEQSDVLLNYDNFNSQKPKDEQVLLPYPSTVQVPGFVTLIFLIAVIAIVLIFKYKKKDKKNLK